MIDEVQITISAYTFEKLCEIHNKWRKQKGSFMAEQDLNYVINRLIEEKCRKENSEVEK